MIINYRKLKREKRYYRVRCREEGKDEVKRDSGKVPDRCLNFISTDIVSTDSYKYHL